MGWLDRLRVTVEEGDILAASAEGMVCTFRDDLGPYGELSKKLLALCGEGLREDLVVELSRRGLERLALGQALSVAARPQWSLAARRLIFTVMWSRESPYTPNLAYANLAGGIREGLDHRLASLAIPIFTMGRDAKGAAMADEAIGRVLLDFDGLKRADTFSVEEIRFLSWNGRAVERLREHLAEVLPG